MSELDKKNRAGFYETFRTSHGRVHHWNYNFARLRRSCAHAGLTLPATFLAIDEARLQSAVTELLRSFEVEDAVFRYAVTGGDDSSVPAAFRVDRAGAPATEELTSRPLPLPAPAEGIALRVLKVRRGPGDWLPRPKNTHDPELRRAAEEIHARAVAASDEGLLLSAAGGFVVETSRQSIFWVCGDRVFYPAPDLGGIPGTCFAWLLDRGLTAQPVQAPLDSLVRADAVAVCNAVRGVTPVQELWEAEDRTCLRRYESSTHPLIGSLAEAWRASLARIAAGP